MVIPSQAGLDLWEVRANRTKMRRTALTTLEPLVFPRISTEIGLALAVAVDGMLGQSVAIIPSSCRDPVRSTGLGQYGKFSAF